MREYTRTLPASGLRTLDSLRHDLRQLYEEFHSLVLPSPTDGNDRMNLSLIALRADEAKAGSCRRVSSCVKAICQELAALSGKGEKEEEEVPSTSATLSPIHDISMRGAGATQKVSFTHRRRRRLAFLASFLALVVGLVLKDMDLVSTCASSLLQHRHQEEEDVRRGGDADLHEFVEALLLVYASFFDTEWLALRLTQDETPQNSNTRGGEEAIIEVARNIAVLIAQEQEYLAAPYLSLSLSHPPTNQHQQQELPQQVGLKGKGDDDDDEVVMSVLVLLLGSSSARFVHDVMLLMIELGIFYRSRREGSCSLAQAGPPVPRRVGEEASMTVPALTSAAQSVLQRLFSDFDSASWPSC